VEDPRRRLDTQAFGDGVQDLGDADLRCFETVERSVPACRKLRMASLAVEILDGIMLAVVAIPDEGVEGGVRNGAIVTFWVGTGLAARVYRLFTTAWALSLGLRHDNPSRCRRRCAGRSSTVRTVVWRAGPQ
jgi:hypothetical protein